MTKKSDAPAIRFKGFSDAWEQRKLGDIGETYTGLSGKTKADFGHGQARFVTYMNVFSNPISDPEMTEPIEIDPKQNEVEVGDVFFTTSSETPEEVGMSSVLLEKRGKTYLNSFCFGFRPSEKIDSYYLAYMLRSESARDKIILLAQGISRYNISKNKVMEIAVSLPSLDEQKLIGQYFRQLDNLITLHQRKFEKLTNVKKSMLEKMFPQNGSSYPEIRFKGFTDPWEQRKLSEIADKVTEKNAGLQYVETFTNSAEFGIISQRDFFDHDIAKLGSLDGYYIVKNEDFVYNPRISTSAPVGPINRNKLGRTGVMSPLYTVFRPHDIDTTYLEYFFKCGYWHSFMNFNGDSGARSDRFSIRDNVFFQMPIPIPDIDEQRKIGELLTCLDNLITLHQRQPFLQSPPDISLIVQLTPPFYTFSWEQRKLGDMMNVTSVKRIHQSDWTDSGVRFLRARDIVAAAKNEEPDDYLYISKEKYEEYSTLSGKVGVSDLLVTGVGTIGVPYLVRNLEPLYFKDGNIIWFQNSDKIDGKFLFYSFSAEQIQGFINESAGIGTVGTYTIESGKKTPISLPNQIEQAKVGEFFQQLDNLITLHQRKPFLMKWRTSDANRNQTNRLVL